MYFIGGGVIWGAGVPCPRKIPPQSKKPHYPPPPNPFFSISLWGAFKQDIQFPRNPPSPDHSSDPSSFPTCILVAWNSVQDPPETEISARILGIALRPVFGQNFCSIMTTL